MKDLLCFLSKCFLATVILAGLVLGLLSMVDSRLALGDDTYPMAKPLRPANQSEMSRLGKIGGEYPSTLYWGNRVWRCRDVRTELEQGLVSVETVQGTRIIASGDWCLERGE